MKIDENAADVDCNGQKIVFEKYAYIMFYKPQGIVSATEDKREETVLDFLKKVWEVREETPFPKGLFPVGRLDKDTEGLLLITNDGALAHRLLSPKKHVDKVYYAKVEGVVTEEDVRRFAEGLCIGQGEEASPSKLVILKSGAVSEIELTIQEGKFHQVKRMFEAVGKNVIYLKRLSMGALKLDETLEKGSYRLLSKEELEQLC